MKLNEDFVPTFDPSFFISCEAHRIMRIQSFMVYIRKLGHWKTEEAIREYLKLVLSEALGSTNHYLSDDERSEFFKEFERIFREDVRQRNELLVEHFKYVCYNGLPPQPLRRKRKHINVDLSK